VKIEFWGAARNVTGSRHLLNVNGTRILLDCGMFQGHRKEAEQKNRDLKFDARSIDCVVLSHAHIDHSGCLPSLVKSGFLGNIYATYATRDLCAIMLPDSAHIQEQDARYLNKKHKKKGLPPVEPLYNHEDVEKTLQLFVSVGFERPIPIAPGVNLQFFDAGHILGSAVTCLDIKENGSERRLVYTGDLGRWGLPILKDPVPTPPPVIYITETTYGDKLHDPVEKMDENLADVVKRTIGRGGKIVIPAFSVGRTQEVVYCLRRLNDAGRIPPVPVFVDSPLSVNATEVFRLHPECFDDKTLEYVQSDRGPFSYEHLTYIRDRERSMELNKRKEPCIIISASGMCEAGRILHHLKHNIQDAKNTVLIVGYCAEHTLGRRIVEREPRVNIFGEPHSLNAEVVVLNSFSAHADRDDLVRYMHAIDGTLDHVFLVHGDEKRATAFAETVRGEFKCPVDIPKEGSSFEFPAVQQK
jgi:metallo-beta-lactamase family protein